jgi:4-hydroxy-3-polyprenylbenzoate decarboxylase
MPDLVVAITGASGSIYAVRLLQVLLSAEANVHLTISPAGVQVLAQELDLRIELGKFEQSQLLPDLEKLPADSRLRVLLNGCQRLRSRQSGTARARLIYHHYQDFTAGIASGSFLTGGMVVCPCSMGTLAGLASGISSNLVHRAADVHLKERRKLIVVPREAPLGTIQLENMLRLAQAGAVILPAMPGFYQRPDGIGNLVDFVVGRICDQLGVQHELFRRWGEDED